MHYVEALAGLGIDEALRTDRTLARSLSTYAGKLITKPVADCFDIPAEENPFLTGQE